MSETIKFSIDIDQEDGNILDQVIQVAGQNLSSYFWGYQKDEIQRRMQSKLEKQSNEEIEKLRVEIKRWDKDTIAHEVWKEYGPSICTAATRDTIRLLMKDKDFIAAVATAVIKQQFK